MPQLCSSSRILRTDDRTYFYVSWVVLVYLLYTYSFTILHLFKPLISMHHKIPSRIRAVFLSHWYYILDHTYCLLDCVYRSSRDLLRGASCFNEQYRKCRRGPVAAPATRAPSGAVSVPLPRTPRENIRSKTATKKLRTNARWYQEAAYARVTVKAFAVIWQLSWVSDKGGLTPSSVRRYR
jgi:hypothetical protein